MKNLLLKRLLAFIIDLMIIQILLIAPFQNLILELIPEASFTSTYQAVLQLQSILAPVFFYMILFTLAYFILLEYAIGQTVGKIFLNIRVTSMKGELRFWQVVLRRLFMIPVFPFSILTIADPVFLLFDKKQRLTEKLAQTQVKQ